LKPEYKPELAQPLTPVGPEALGKGINGFRETDRFAPQRERLSASSKD
jgi:hypothetical protein